jgi:hypothetical protein
MPYGQTLQRLSVVLSLFFGFYYVVVGESAKTISAPGLLLAFVIGLVGVGAEFLSPPE